VAAPATAVPATIVAVQPPSGATDPVRWLLVLTGLLGLVLTVGLAVTLTSLQLGDLATETASTLRAAERSSRDAARAVDGAATAASAGGDIARQLRNATESAATALEIEILGVRPLAPAADDFREVGAGAENLAATLDSASAAAQRAGEDLDVLADELGGLSETADRTAEESVLGSPLFGYLLVGVVAWLGLQSVTLIGLGLRRRSVV
jgi:hypothetical protein